jgi:hypothetical protein
MRDACLVHRVLFQFMSCHSEKNKFTVSEERNDVAILLTTKRNLRRLKSRRKRCVVRNSKTEKLLSRGKKKLHGFSPQVNYTDRAIAAGQRS